MFVSTSINIDVLLSYAISMILLLVKSKQLLIFRCTITMKILMVISYLNELV